MLPLAVRYIKEGSNIHAGHNKRRATQVAIGVLISTPVLFGLFGLTCTAPPSRPPMPPGQYDRTLEHDSLV